MVHCTEEIRVVPLPGSTDVLTEVLRAGAQKLLAQAVEAEVADWIEQRQHCVDAEGHRQVVRNGHLPGRTISTGIGPVEVRQPRVRDRRPAGQAERFSSKILPPYLRKTKAVEELIPWLYLKGVSTGDFSEALAALLGPDAKGLSATTITRLKAIWEKDYQDWSKRSLAGNRYVCVWADGVYFNIRLAGGRQCILVLMGATADGKKELIAIQDGQRESEQSWKELLLDVQSRGLTIEPKLAIGGGGSWGSGRRCGNCGPMCVSSVAGCIKRPTYWTSCPRAYSPRPRRCCTPLTWRRAVPKRRKPSTCSCGPSRRSTSRRRSAWPRIGGSFWCFMTSLRSTGCIYGRPT